MSLCDEVEYLALAVGERWEGLGRGSSWGRGCEVREYPGCYIRAEDGLAPTHRPDGVHHLLLVGVLEDVAASTGPQGHEHRVFVFEKRYHQDTHTRSVAGSSAWPLCRSPQASAGPSRPRRAEVVRHALRPLRLLLPRLLPRNRVPMRATRLHPCERGDGLRR